VFGASPSSRQCNGIVYAGSTDNTLTDNTLYALDARTGSGRWHHQAAATS
jgi:outer membrane protein assembly factor BamB